jgi:hypothetical protein
MDPKKREQLNELRKDRTKVIKELRNQLKHFDVNLLLTALVSLAETGDILDQWEHIEREEQENEKQTA